MQNTTAENVQYVARHYVRKWLTAYATPEMIDLLVESLEDLAAMRELSKREQTDLRMLRQIAAQI